MACCFAANAFSADTTLKGAPLSAASNELTGIPMTKFDAALRAAGALSRRLLRNDIAPVDIADAIMAEGIGASISVRGRLETAAALRGVAEHLEAPHGN